MYMQADLARDRIRGQQEEAKHRGSVRQLKALSRAKRAERKAEARLLQAWRARAQLEAKLG
jgi:hypothetical protein